MNNWVVLTAEKCPWCTSAKGLLHERDIEFRSFDIHDRPDLKEFLLESGLWTVPQVYLNGNRIGGYEDLKAHFDKQVA